MMNLDAAFLYPGPMGGRRGAAAAMAGAVLLLACAYHLTGRGDDTVLIKRDKYGIPVDGSDNAHPSPARAMAKGGEAAGEAHGVVQGLEIKTNSISKVLNSIQDEVKSLATEVSSLSAAKDQVGHPAVAPAATGAATAVSKASVGKKVAAGRLLQRAASAAATAKTTGGGGAKKEANEKEEKAKAATAVLKHKQQQQQQHPVAAKQQRQATKQPPGAKNALLQDLLKNGGIVMPPTGPAQETSLERMKGEIDRALSMAKAAAQPKAASLEKKPEAVKAAAALKPAAKAPAAAPELAAGQKEGTGVAKKAVGAAAAAAAAVPPSHRLAVAPAAAAESVGKLGEGNTNKIVERAAPSMLSSDYSRASLEREERVVSSMERRETSLLDELPEDQSEVHRDKAAVADTRQTVSIARDRLALARRAVQNDESETGSRVMPNLLRAEDVAEEDKDRVENELNGEERKLDRDEEVAAEAPELAKVLAAKRKELARDRLKERMEQQLREAQSLMNNRNFAG